MKRGEVWTLRDSRGRASHLRVVVVSSDAYNDQPGALPHAVPIVRKSPGERPSQYVARLGETDPIAGVAVVNRLIRVHPSFAAQQVGILTGASMEMIGSTVRDLYELN